MADQQQQFEDPSAVIKETLLGGTQGNTAGASPGASSTAAPMASAIPVAPAQPTTPGAPQGPQTPGLFGTAINWLRNQGARVQADAKATHDRQLPDAGKAFTGDVQGAWQNLHGAFSTWYAETAKAPPNLLSVDGLRQQFTHDIHAGKVMGNAALLLTSPFAGLWDEAVGAASKGLGHLPGPNASEWKDMLDQASIGLGPETGTGALLGDVHTATVTGRASTTGAVLEGGVRASAAGEAADANKVTFRAKPNGTSSDAWRNVGTMDKGDLQRFYDQANSYAGKPLESLNVNEANSPELYQGIGQVNLSRMQSPGDATLFMRAALDNIPAQMRPLSDVDLAAQVRAGADAIGVDRDALTTYITNIARDTSKLPQAVGIVRAAYQSIAGAIEQDAKLGLGGFEEGDLETARGHFDTAEGQGAPLGPLTPEEGRGAELAKRLTNVQTALNWGASFSDIGTGLGRGLRALQLPAVDYDGLMTHLTTLGAEAPPAAPGTNFKPPQSLQDLDKFYRLWNAANGDETSRMNLLMGRNSVPAPGWYLRNSFANFYTGSLLAGKAIVKGYLMPTFMGALQTFERTSAAGLASINPLLSAEDRATFGAISKASATSYFQTMGDFTSAFRYSIDVTKNGGRSLIRPGRNMTKYDDAGRMGPITQEMIDAAGGKSKPAWAYQLGNAINVWPRAVFSLVGGHDELTNRLSYLGRVRMTAQVAAQRAGVTDPLELKSYINNAMADAIDPASGAATHPDILNEAARASFMNSTADSPMGRTIQTVNSARNSVPELRYILPVLNVPAAGLGEAIRRIPGVNFMFENTRAELAGDHGQIRQADAYGRMITGATLLGAGYGLARGGLITGGGPSNPEDKAQWENNGYQPFSVKVDGHWFSYKDWEPAGAILGIMGNMFDHTVHYPEDDQTHSKVVASIAALAEYAKDKAAMQSVSNLLSFGEEGTSPDRWVAKTFGGVASGFEPAFLKYARNAADPDLRGKSSVWDYVTNGIPGQSQTLPPLRNTFGEPIHSPNDASNVYGLMPWTISAANASHHDPVAEELDKVYQLTGYAGGVTHPAELTHGFYDAQALRLENGRTMFDQFAANRLQPNDNWDGMNVKSKLADLFASDDYKGAVYGSPSRANDPNTDEASKLNMIAKIFREANSFSKQKLAQDSPMAKRYLAVGNAKSDSPDVLRAHTADELAGNPPLLKSLGIDINQYEDKVSGQ